MEVIDYIIEALRCPYSVIAGIGFLGVAWGLHYWAGSKRWVAWLGQLLTARVLLALGAIMLVVEGTCSVPLHRTVPFAVYVLVLLLALAFTLLNGVRRKAKAGFLLNHLGLFLIIWGALFGAPDVSRSKMIVGQDEPQRIAMAADGLPVVLPYEVKLQEFVIDYYPDSISPRQFTSHLLVDGQEMEVAVNSPVSHQGYTLYQESYDAMAGSYTVLQVVRDPWLPVIYLGMLLLAVGSVLLLFGRWHGKWVVPVTAVLTVLFTVFTVAKINFGTLMPALRSWWFVPHIFIYMVAYSLMAFTLVMWMVEKHRKAPVAGYWLSDNLMRSSSALLIIGMLTGSVWARQAWGDYWAWDPKENWAAVTWFVSLMHLHLQDKRGWRGITILILAFLALQITWYGVNYLPSALDSMHTYMR